MKRLLFCIPFLLVPLLASAANYVTIDDLVGHEFSIEDHWAGQELAFVRQDGAIKAVWRILGSGVPVVSQRSCTVEKRSERQCVFFLDPEKKHAEVKISLNDAGEVKAFLDGIRIYITEKKPNQ